MDGCSTEVVGANGWAAQAVVDCWEASVDVLRSYDGTGEEGEGGESHAATMVDASHYMAASVEARTGEEAGQEADLEAASWAATKAASRAASWAARSEASREAQWAVPTVVVVVAVELVS